MNLKCGQCTKYSIEIFSFTKSIRTLCIQSLALCLCNPSDSHSRTQSKLTGPKKEDMSKEETISSSNKGVVSQLPNEVMKILQNALKHGVNENRSLGLDSK